MSWLLGGTSLPPDSKKNNSTEILVAIPGYPGQPSLEQLLERMQRVDDCLVHSHLFFPPDFIQVISSTAVCAGGPHPAGRAPLSPLHQCGAECSFPLKKFH